MTLTSVIMTTTTTINKDKDDTANSVVNVDTVLLANVDSMVVSETILRQKRQAAAQTSRKLNN
jgi:hypothetical protein